MSSHNRNARRFILKTNDEFDALRQLTEVLFSPPAGAPIQAFAPEIACHRAENEKQTVVTVARGKTLAQAVP